MLNFHITPDAAARLLARAYLRTLEFNEALHPRDEAGKFTDGSNSSTTEDKLRQHLNTVTDSDRTFFLLSDGTRLGGSANSHEKLAMSAGLNNLRHVIGSGVVRYVPGVGVQVSSLTETQAEIIADDWNTKYAGSQGWNKLQLDLIASISGEPIETKAFDRVTADALRNFVDRRQRTLGGPGSGNFGHAGRPGEVGGSGPSSGNSPKSSVPAGILEKIRTSGEGFSYHVVSGNVPTTGYAVSVHPDRTKLLDPKAVDRKALALYAKTNWDLLKQDEKYLGGWHDTASGQVFLDVSTIVESSDHAETIARQHKEIAYYDLVKGMEVRIDYTKDKGTLKAASLVERRRLEARRAVLRGLDETRGSSEWARRNAGRDSGSPQDLRQHREVDFRAAYSEDQPRDDQGQWTSGGAEHPIISKAREYFSVALEPYETKFVLPDGTRLRGIGNSHSSAATKIGAQLNEVLKAGVIRYSYGHGGVEILSDITEAQAALIADDWNFVYKSSLWVSAFGEDKLFENPTADGIRNFVKQKLGQLKTARRYAAETLVHHAADAHRAKFAVAVRYAFATGRAAVDQDALKTARTATAALTALKAAPDALQTALHKVLPPVILATIEAGGAAAVEMLKHRLRAAAGFDESQARDDQGQWSGGDISADELFSQPNVMVHGSSKSLTELQPGTMFSDDPVWAAGYTTKLGMGDNESFVGKIHTLPIPDGKTLEARSVHIAEKTILDMARDSTGKEPASLREAAEIVGRETGAVAILSRNRHGKINGGILLQTKPVQSKADPVAALRKAKELNRSIPDNLDKALRSAEFNPDQPRDEDGKWAEQDGVRIRVVANDDLRLEKSGAAAIYDRKNKEVRVKSDYAKNQHLLNHEIGHAIFDESGVQPPMWISDFTSNKKAWEQFVETSTAKSHQSRGSDESKRYPNNPAAYDWIEVQADLYMEYKAGRFDSKIELRNVIERLLPKDFRTAAKKPPFTMRFDVTNPDVIDWAEEHAAELIKGITKTTKKAVRDAVVRAFEEGDIEIAYDDILSAIGDKDRADTIAHTECLPFDTVVGAAVVGAATRRWYVGNLIEIRTRDGRKFSATSNHPMLTHRGWVGAGSLNEGDYLVCDSRQQRSVVASDPNVARPNTTIGEIFDSLATIGVFERRSGTKPDFHGDGQESDVDVTSPFRPLVVGSFAPLYQPLAKQILSESGFAATTFCLFCHRLLSVDQQICLCHCSDIDITASQASYEGAGIDSTFQSQTLSCFSGQIPSNNFVRRKEILKVVGSAAVLEKEVSGIASISGDTGFSQQFVDGGLVGFHALGDFRSGQSGEIQLDCVTFVSVRPFRGHVYNLSTPYGYFTIEGGIYTGNTMSAANEGQRQSWAQAVEEGLLPADMKKIWIATGDENVCILCSELDGKTADLDGEYPDEGGQGPPRHVNCRCVDGISD